MMKLKLIINLFRKKKEYVLPKIDTVLIGVKQINNSSALKRSVNVENQTRKTEKNNRVIYDDFVD